MNEVPPSELLRRRRDEVQAAFQEGHAAGVGMTEPGEAWARSRTRRNLAGNPRGLDIIGRPCICDAGEAAGRTDWVLCGIYGEQAWIVARDDWAQSILVPVSSCRSIVTAAPVLDG